MSLEIQDFSVTVCVLMFFFGKIPSDPGSSSRIIIMITVLVVVTTAMVGVGHGRIPETSEKQRHTRGRFEPSKPAHKPRKQNSNSNLRKQRRRHTLFSSGWSHNPHFQPRKPVPGSSPQHKLTCQPNQPSHPIASARFNATAKTVYDPQLSHRLSLPNWQAQVSPLNSSHRS